MRRSDQWNGYKYRLIAERLMDEYLPAKAVTGDAGYWMNRGIDMESIARTRFQDEKKLQVDQIGFMWESEAKRLGCSPDGLIMGTDDKAAVEIKSPAPWTMVEYLLAKNEDKVWQDYKCQVQGQMIIGQLETVHFWAFHPRMPAKYVRTEPDLPFITTLRQALWDFIGEMAEDLKRARELGPYLTREQVMEWVGEAGGAADAQE